MRKLKIYPVGSIITPNPDLNINWGEIQLTVKKDYEVKGGHYNINWKCDIVRIVDDSGREDIYSSDFFKRAKEKQIK